MKKRSASLAELETISKNMMLRGDLEEEMMLSRKGRKTIELNEEGREARILLGSKATQ